MVFTIFLLFGIDIVLERSENERATNESPALRAPTLGTIFETKFNYNQCKEHAKPWNLNHHRNGWNRCETKYKFISTESFTASYENL